MTKDCGSIRRHTGEDMMGPSNSIKLRKTSVAVTVIISIMAVTAILICGLWVLLNRIIHDRWWGQLHKEHVILADQLSESLVLPIWNFDNSEIGKILEGGMKNENIFGIVVNTTGKQARMYGRMRDTQWDIINAGQEFPTKGLLVEERDIRFANELIGKVRVVASSKFIEGFLHQNNVFMFSVLVSFELILALSLFLLLWRIVLKPLQGIEAYAIEVSSGNAGSTNIQAFQFQGELESLRSSIEKMFIQLGTRYKELQEEVKRRTESEERFLTIFNSVNDAILIHDLDTGSILDVNQKMCEMYGYTREEVRSIDVGTLSSGEAPYTQQEALEWIGKAAKGNPQLVEWRCKDKSGRLFWVEINMRRANIGGIDRLLVVVRDITDRKTSESALQESEERFRGLIEKAPVAISISRGGRTIYVNHKYLALYGFEVADERVGQPVFDEWAPESRNDILERSQKRARGEIVPSTYEGTGQRKDGSHFPVHVVVETVELPDGPALMAFLSDVTERKQAEKALRESEKRFRHLFEGAVDALFVYDQQGRIVGVNEGVCSSLGYTREELLQLSVPDVEVGLHPADLAPIRDRVLSGQSVIVEGVHRRRDGSTFPVEVHVALFTATEGPLFFAAARDITERKRAEEELTQYRAHLEELVEVRTAELSEANKKLKELDLLKSMFIASMSHELRTPLNSIIGFTGMTLQGMSGELNDEQKDNLTRAYLSAKHLLSLITDVIDISKIEAGRIEAYPEGFVLREMVNDAIATIEPQLKDKGLTIEVDVPPETNLTTDRKRLLQCLINFLGNAVKFTESGGVTIASWKADGQVFLSVSDTGIGIAQKDMHRMFEPFERLETHLRVKTGGTGLGLYLTKKLAIDVLRGDVSVTSLEGQGSTFTIRVPEDIRQAQKASIERSGGDIV
ncbi:MAG: PAS domain S-box protein [Thermodesulfovibrionales bacterium]